MNLEAFRKLSAHERAMVTIAILLDGHEAALYLSNDSISGARLQQVSEAFASINPEFRNILAGCHLRVALEDIQERAEAEPPPKKGRPTSLDL